MVDRNGNGAWPNISWLWCLAFMHACAFKVVAMIWAYFKSKLRGIELRGDWTACSTEVWSDRWFRHMQMVLGGDHNNMDSPRGPNWICGDCQYHANSEVHCCHNYISTTYIAYYTTITIITSITYVTTTVDSLFNRDTPNNGPLPNNGHCYVHQLKPP